MLYETVPAGYVKVNVKHGPYSPSRLIVAKCPQRFYGQYVRKDRVIAATQASARGSAIHEILEKITKKHVAGEKIGSNELNSWVSEAIGKYPASYSQAATIKGAAEAYVGNPSPFTLSTTLCEQEFAVAMYEEDTFYDDAVKKRIYVKVPYQIDGKPNPEVYFGGRLDQVTVDHSMRSVTILDHKSTPTTAVNEDHLFQLRAYAWLVSMFYPGYTMKTSIHYAHPSLNTYSSPDSWYADELSETEAEIHTYIEAVEAFETYDAIPGSGCDYCHMSQECPVLLKIREQQARGELDLNVENEADLQRLASSLQALNKAKDDISDALKSGMEKLSITRINLPGVWYGHKASEESVDWIRTDVRIREESMRAKRMTEDGEITDETRSEAEFLSQFGTLEKILAKYGVEPDAFRTWSGQKLKNIWRLDKPELIEVLRKYVVKDAKSTRFGAHKS